MTDIILYPTETIYGLGVNALDPEAIQELAALKNRDESQAVSWLVRDIEDIKKYAEVSQTAAKIAQQFLPGPLTLILPAKDTVPNFRSGPEKQVSFRISSDPVAQKVIADFMQEHDAPLTCTSANVHGEQPQPTPDKIIQQFKEHGRPYSAISRTIDDGPRQGIASTIVRATGDTIEILREGLISKTDVLKVIKQLKYERDV